jgi:hypothetical protein
MFIYDYLVINTMANLNSYIKKAADALGTGRVHIFLDYLVLPYLDLPKTVLLGSIRAKKNQNRLKKEAREKLEAFGSDADICAAEIFEKFGPYKGNRRTGTLNEEFIENSGFEATVSNDIDVNTNLEFPSFFDLRGSYAQLIEVCVALPSESNLGYHIIINLITKQSYVMNSEPLKSLGEKSKIRKRWEKHAKELGLEVVK